MQGLVRNGITLLSGIDPVRRAERTADAVSVKDRTLYFCPSPIFGYGLEKFLSRLETEAPNSAILCIEADEELYDLSKKNMEPPLLAADKLHLTNVIDAENLYVLVRNRWGARAFRRVEVIKFTGGWQLFPELYDSLCETLRREIATDWSNALTLAKLGRLYIRNALKNLSLIPRMPSIANLSFGDENVLVLGAGPSLDDSLDALKQRFGDLLCRKEERPFKIICVDTCLSALKDRLIIPDLVVILESQHWNLCDFTGCKGWKVTAAIDLSALPQSTEVLGGGGFLFMTPWTNLKIFERLKEADLLPAVVPPLGSVGNTAVELARRLTGGKIICAGLDFSFTQDKFHARGTPGHRAYLNTKTRFKGTAVYASSSFTSVSKAGFSVLSNPSMRNYRELFEKEFGGDSRLFDISGSGLPLGVKTLSVDEALVVLGEGTVKNFSHRGIEPSVREDTETQAGSIEEGKESSALLKEKLQIFIEEEKKRLIELRDILTGEAEAEQERLGVLLDECDYLWGHFPDYAGGRKPDCGDLSFLKRVRTEIDPMITRL